MGPFTRTVPVLSVISLLLGAPSGVVAWSSNPAVNTPVCVAALSQESPRIAPRGFAGGAVTIAWDDWRGGGSVYAQGFNGVGLSLWTLGGVQIASTYGIQTGVSVVTDLASGAIIAWNDNRTFPDTDVYAQRINSSGTLLWTPGGIPICAVTGPVYEPVAIPDGSGGAIIAWADLRSEQDIYAQRVNASGSVLWTANGVALCTAAGPQYPPKLVSDGAGGAIVAWPELRGASVEFDIYARRITGAGVPQWTADGVAVCTVGQDQENPIITSDGAGGAIIAWNDSRSDFGDIYAQRLNAAGVAQWTAGGVAVCAAAGTQRHVSGASDGAGGMILAWDDTRSGAEDIYAQRIRASGSAEWPPGGVPVCTAPGTQWVPAVVEGTWGGAVIAWVDYRGGGTSDIYAQRVAANGTSLWTANGVAICTAANAQGFPVITSDLVGGAVIAWPDLRGGAEFDIYAQQVSSAGLLGSQPTDVAGAGGRSDLLALHANRPNPFRTQTTIGYETPSVGRVRLEVFDVRGRLAATPLDELRGPGHGEITLDMRDQPAGVYLMRLQAGSDEATRKVLLLP